MRVIAASRMARFGTASARRLSNLPGAPLQGYVAGGEAAMPKFEIKPLKDHSGFYVLVTWPEGQAEHVNGFQSEAEADAWITNDTATWLARHPRSRSVRPTA